jgi:hypothetical protein
MSTQIQRRRGTTGEHSTFTGAAGEITIDSTKNTVVVHDGTTAGGFPLAKEANALTSSAIGVTVQAYDANNTADANLNSFIAAVNLPTSDGTAGQFLKTDGAGTVTFDTIPTINALNDIANVTITSASSGEFLKWNGSAWINDSIPTINTLNDISNVTITSATTGEFLQWNGSAWVNAVVEAFDVQTQTTSAVTQVTVASYNATTYDGIKVVITMHDSVATERSITELLITHDGTTAVATEYAQVNTATALATFDVDISGGNVRILATPASTNSTAFTVKAITL